MSLDKLKIYIAGPMRGYPNNNHAEFDRAEEHLLKKEIYIPINPARIDREAGVNPADDMTKLELRDALKRDFDLIFDCHAMYMLSGWGRSDGARAEHALAIAMGMGIYYE